MATNLTVNGTVYSFPNTGDQNWGDVVTNWATAVSNSTLQLTGGSFTLTADLDFGANFGVLSLYYKSRATHPATVGVVRLGSAELIGWRNAANNANYTFGLSSGNVLTFKLAGGSSFLLVDPAGVAQFGVPLQIDASNYIYSNGTPAGGGLIRLQNNEEVAWRDSGNTANYSFAFNTIDKFAFRKDGTGDLATLDTSGVFTASGLNLGDTTLANYKETSGSGTCSIFSGGGSITAGSATLTYKFTRIGNVVHFSVSVATNGSFAITGTAFGLGIALPSGFGVTTTQVGCCLDTKSSGFYRVEVTSGGIFILKIDNTLAASSWTANETTNVMDGIYIIY